MIIHTIELSVSKSYLLECGQRLILVDTGYSAEEADKILERVRTLGRDNHDVKYCILTHRHEDHTLGLRRIKESTGASIVSHEAEAPEIERISGVQVDVKVRDHEVMDECGGIEFIHVPGHTAGNLCLYIRKERALFAGDTVFADEQGRLSPPPEIYCDDAAMARGELKRLLALDFEKIYVSHGENLLTGAKEALKKIVER